MNLPPNVSPRDSDVIPGTTSPRFEAGQPMSSTRHLPGLLLLAVPLSIGLVALMLPVDPVDSGGPRSSMSVASQVMTPATVPASAPESAPSTHEGTARYWPQWRGPLGTGVAPFANPPIRWSETENIRWKTELEGTGHSTPILWRNKIFVTTAVPTGESLPARFSMAPGGHDEVPITHRHRFVVMAIDRRDGKILWDRTLREELPHEGGHRTASLASASPVTDGEHLIVSFGSRGLYGLDLEGNVLWQVDFGDLHSLHGHGEGSSPALHGDAVVISWDQEGKSFLATLDKSTGQERWRVDRVPSTSWSTPIVVESNGRFQILACGSKRIHGYDLLTGETIWECSGLSKENVVATPVTGNGLVYFGSSYDRPGVFAVRYGGASGDISGTDRIVWKIKQGAPYVPSPLLYGRALYFLYQFQGIFSRVDAVTGKGRPGRFRLNGLRTVFASPLGADGRVYVAGREGTTLVIRNDDAPTVLATNHLDDSFSASPIACDSDLYLRGERFLYCLSDRAR